MLDDWLWRSPLHWCVEALDEGRPSSQKSSCSDVADRVFAWLRSAERSKEQVCDVLGFSLTRVPQVEVLATVMGLGTIRVALLTSVSEILK
jgi:hypothetical protein